MQKIAKKMHFRTFWPVLVVLGVFLKNNYVEKNNFFVIFGHVMGFFLAYTYRYIVSHYFEEIFFGIYGHFWSFLTILGHF